MYAVIDTEYKVLVAIFLTKGDANQFVNAQYDKSNYEVREFEFDWSHWVEARKELGIY